MSRRGSVGAFSVLMLLTLACAPTAPTKYVEETLDVAWGTLGGVRRYTYEFDIPADGFFEITLERWTWDDNDVFEIELVDAADDATLLRHRPCDPWAKLAGAACDSVANQLPASARERVAGGHRVLMRMYHEKGALGFRVHVKRPG